MDDNGKFDTWAILELMGHRRLAGFLTEEEHCGQSMIRLDVHDADGIVTTQFYSGAAVYCITPTTEEIARQMGARSKPAPVARYELEPPRGSYDADDADGF
ncbi:MAG TPA: hypothetical protein VLA52_07375 [Thermohalobaculum sp.]|nr:hypothetical protein [Thermohalobaculum sp.]